MADYTSFDYVYFNNMADKTKRYHIGFILNKRHDMYIISPLKIMVETFVSITKLLVF